MPWATITPNPFNAETAIRFAIPAAGGVVLDIYNLSGQLVARLMDGELQAGSYEIKWDGRGCRGRIRGQRRVPVRTAGRLVCGQQAHAAVEVAHRSVFFRGSGFWPGQPAIALDPRFCVSAYHRLVHA